MSSKEINGRIVSYEDASEYAASYLKANYEEAEGLFNKAVSSPGTFECEYGGYKLSWSGGSNYSLLKKY